MKTLKIMFSKNGASFDLGAPLYGEFECSVQNALVNIATLQGSDYVFPEKGTTIYKSALNGSLVDLNAARHAANFAALDTFLFLRDTDYLDAVERIANIELRALSIAQGVLTVETVFTSSTGRVSGTLTPI